jgi:hypothetical protein
MRWNKAFDGTIDSLKEKSRRPHSPHPNSHTDIEINFILENVMPILWTIIDIISTLQ